MSALIAGVLVIATFLLASVLMFGTFLTSSASQAQSLKDMGRVNLERTGSAISIISATVTSTGSGTNLTVLLDNTGSRSVGNFAQMDVIVQYTDPDDDQVGVYLTYLASGLGDNQWTNPVTGITPDTFNPRMWDPDETLTINLRLVPAVKVGTSALVVVATPWATGDQTTVSND